MKPELLLQHFDRISEAPDAIPRLRRFILDLAVRGKLVEQDPNDEPAGELLKRIQAEKARTKKRQQDMSEEDYSGEWDVLQSGWEVVPLIDLGSWAIGSGFPKNEQGLSDGPYFFLKVSDMNLPGNEKYITTSNNFVDDDAAGRMRAKIHPPGTIIFPKIGGAIATNKRRILTKGAAIDNNCLGITFSSEVDTEWAYLLLTTLDFTQYQAGTAVPALQQGVLERIPVGLPPLAEQHRIVAKVDELMTLCDQLEAERNQRETHRDKLVASSLNRISTTPAEEAKDAARFHLNLLPRLTTKPEHIKQLRQTILNLAVRGKLVEQDPNDEPAEELLKRIQAEKERLVKEGKIKKEKPINAIMAGDTPFGIPSNWCWIPLGELTELITKGSSPKWQGISYSSKEDGVLFVTSENVGNYCLRKLDEPKYVEKRFNEIEPRSILQRGDILMNLVGASIGRTAVYDLPDIANINQAVALIRLVNPEANQSTTFLLHYFNSPTAIQFMTASQVVTAQPNISLTNAREFPIPLPPLAEQQRIVAKVDELMGLCDQLEAQLTTTTADSRRLLEAILRDALQTEMKEAA